MKKHVIADIEQLKKVIKVTNYLLNDTNKENFLSPYSVVPVISQILGLNSPLLGTGKSPYSVISIILDLAQKRRFFREAFKIPFNQKRLIVDDIYNAIAPCLLAEEEQYITFLRNTIYKNQDITSLRERIYLIKKFIMQFYNKNGGDFAHIAHYGYVQDLSREHHFLNNLSNNRKREWFQDSYPIVNELILRINGQEIKGWIIFIANSTEQLLKDGKLRKRKILQVASLANSLGARIISMGGLVASFAQGGYYLAEQFKNLGFTTGHAYTIGNILQIVEQVARKVKLNLNKAQIAIVGAAGSIGSGCSKLLVKKGIKRLILVETVSFASRKKLEELKVELQRLGHTLELELSETLYSVKKADLIIVATNSPTALIKPLYLKKGAVVIDDSFPKNVSKNILSQRKDIILLEGGAVNLPITTDIDVARNMPDLMDAPLTRLVSCKEVYGCLAEGLTLAFVGHRGSYGLGYADPKLAKEIIGKAKRIGFHPAPLQCFDSAIEEERYKTNQQFHKEK